MKNKKAWTFAILLILMLVVTVPTVYAGDFTCEVFGDNSFMIDEKFAKIVSTVILIIQVVGPILLVVWGMLDLAKAVMAQKEDEIKKGQQTFVKRLLAAVVMFFVIAVVKLVINFVADDEGIMNCVECFLNGPEDCGVTDN